MLSAPILLVIKMAEPVPVTGRDFVRYRNATKVLPHSVKLFLKISRVAPPVIKKSDSA